MAIGVIAKTATAMKEAQHPMFRLRGAIPYDQRSIRLKPDGTVSISTIEGRRRLKVRVGRFQSEKLGRGFIKSGMKLCWRRYDSRFYLAVVVDSQDPTPRSSGILGIDLGIKNIATDSEGKVYTNILLDRTRSRYGRLRAKLQSVGTKSAKRHLKKISGRERRFKRDVNHCISKKIVEAAKGTCSMIAMEDLTHIRNRTTVRRSQRDRYAKWAFRELRKFVEYKAAMQGVPTILVDPRNTSRTCPRCQTTNKRNRPTRDLFKCIECGYAAPADFVGAQNVRNEAAFSLPIVAPVSVATIS